MTVAELIKILQKVNPEYKVVLQPEGPDSNTVPAVGVEAVSQHGSETVILITHYA